MKFPQKPRKPKFLALSFYYSALIIFCQVFMPISSVSAASSANNFTFSDYTADFYLSQAEDGSSRLRVVEEFTAVFPDSNQNHGITRVIPYTNQDGENLTMESDDYLVIDVKHNGAIEDPYKVEGSDGYFTVYLGSPNTYVHGEQTYTLEYEFRNVITNQSDGDAVWQELYWDTNGNDWQQKFQKVTARVHFADEAIAQNYTNESWCYVGRYGSNGSSRCQTEKIADGLQFSATNLFAGENLTFVLTFAPNTFAVPGRTYDYRLLIALVIACGVILAMVVAMIIIAGIVKDKRQYYKNLFTKAEYTPAKGLTVADMAENYLKSGKLGSSKVATMMELAVQHKIEIKKLVHPKKSSKSKTKYSWWITVKSLDLTAAQVTVLKILAGGMSSLSVGQGFSLESHNANSSLIQLGRDFDKYVQQSLRNQGLLEVNKNSKKTTIKNPAEIVVTAMGVWMFIGVFAMAFLFEDIPSYRHLIGGGWGIAALVVLLVGGFIASLVYNAKISAFFTHTKKGLEYSKYLDGLGMYIKMAEANRLKFLQSVDGVDTTHQGVVKVYEKLLPYAVLFKMEKSWLDEMSKYYAYDDVAEPNWYIGTGAFIAHDFSRAMRAASTTMNTNITHSTISNSSSGFSGAGGGGFSGGGGGGGGGGGW